jgi:DNA-directed RNA polymerase, mitochondrial
MSEIIRETFIHLHSSDVMVKLRDEVSVFSCMMQQSWTQVRPFLCNQFNTRYKGYAIPLLSLNRSEIARINDETDITIQTSVKLTKKEAEQLVTSSRDDQACDPTIKSGKLAEDAEDVEDAEEVSEDTEDSTPVMEYRDPVLVLPKGYSQDLAAEGSKALSLKKHRGRASAILGVPEHDSALPAYKQFVPLLSVLPPLPPKGDFSVETIKRSLYFFS